MLAKAVSRYAVAMRNLALAAALAVSLAGGVVIAQHVASRNDSAVVAPQDAAPDLASIAARRPTPAGLRVFQHVPPPENAADAARFAWGPVTDTATQQVDRNVRSTWNGRLHAMLWGMRAMGGPSTVGNPVRPRIDVNGAEAGMEFTSFDRADAATLAVVAYHCGHKPHQADKQGYLDLLNAAGLPDTAWIDRATAETKAATIFTKKSPAGSRTERVMVVDRVVAPDGRQWDVAPQRRAGILIDWEVSDGRSGPQATRALIAAARMITAAGMEPTLYMNPLNGSNPRQEGLDASNLPALHAAFRWMTILVWARSREGSAAESIANQVRLLQGTSGLQPIDYSRLMLTVGVGEGKNALSGADVAAARAALLGRLPGLPPGAGGRQAFGSVNLWRKGGKPQAGSAYNRAIATLVGANDN